MYLQRLLFPKAEICYEEQLYYHKMPEKVRLDSKLEALMFDNNGTAEFDTYFNSFSIEKWKKYTTLGELKIQLELKGKFCVKLQNKEKINANIVERIIQTYVVDAKDRVIYEFDFSSFDQQGMYCFKLEALEDNSVYYGGAYFTEEESANILPNINIAINMCTYHREKFVYRNVEILNRSILQNEESPLFGHLRLYITDNGRSLDKEKVQSELIKVFPQADVGGAGGFTRGLIEILNDKNKYNITHVIMMDDDVLIEPESIVRTYTFLCYLKKEYKEAFVGGALLRSDFQCIQTASGGNWNLKKCYIMFKCFVNILSCSAVLENEVEENAKINGWWYHCLPISSISETNLPFPMFFHMDDVEYDLRNCKKLILLNGICVWHEPFEYKPGSYLIYYNTRNVPISNILHFQNFKIKQMQDFLLDMIIEPLLCCRYREVNLALRATEDFLKGIDYLVSQNPEELLEDVINNGYKKSPVEDLPIPFNLQAYNNSLVCTESKWRRKIRRLLLNGFFLPANRTAIVPMYAPLKRNFYRVKRALNYDPISSKAYITEKSYTEFFRILKRYVKVRHLINRKFSIVAQEYRSRWTEVTNLSFWEKYLHISKE